MTKNYKNIKVVFAGSGSFAKVIFEKTISLFSDVTLISKQEKPCGRGQKIFEPEIIQIAKKHKIPVISVSDKKELAQVISDHGPDIVITASFGMIIPDNVLAIPKYGFLNVHPSLLPKYRGTSPIEAAIINGDCETGITIILLDRGIDTGDILLQLPLPIAETDDKESLERKLASLAGQSLEGFIARYLQGRIEPIAQNESRASYTKKIEKRQGRLDWTESAKIIERKIRAYRPWPGTHTYWNGKMLKILKGQDRQIQFREKPGTFIVSDKGEAYIVTGFGSLELIEIQLEGRKPLKIKDFLLGASRIVGSRLD